MKNLLSKLFDGNRNQKLKMPNFEDSEVVRAHIVFKGRVQGVGFRYNSYDIALKLGLTGYVQNLQDGTVELEAQGERDKIKFLIEYMKNLPIPYVEEVDYNEINLKEEDKFKLT